MVKKAQVIDINNESTSYDDIAEVVNEEAVNEEVANESPEETPLSVAPETQHEAVVKAKPKRKAKTPALKRSDSSMVVIPEALPDVAEDVESTETVIEPVPEAKPAPKARAKRAAKVKVVESAPEVVEEIPSENAVTEKPKRIRKPKEVIAPEVSGAAKQIPVIARNSRAARREEIYSNLAESALP